MLQLTSFDTSAAPDLDNQRPDSKAKTLEEAASSPSDLRVMLTFGEHARELIPSEVALALIQSVCSDPFEVRPKRRRLQESFAAQPDNQKAIPQSLTIMMLPLLNRWGRDNVMYEGELCLRSNKEGIDLNRDFPTASDPLRPQSYEGRILRKIIDAFQPQLYLDVHSGSEFIGYPPGSELVGVVDMEQKTKALDKFLAAGLPPSLSTMPLENIRSKLAYDSSGNAVDYVFANMPAPVLSFAVEVFEESKSDRLLGQKMVGNPTDASGSGFLTQQHGGAAAMMEQCFYEFNPTSKQSLKAAVDKWTDWIHQFIQASIIYLGRQPGR